ncbi:MAG: hypothetical protein ABI863_13055 [Ginsengibacter sp.]
MNGASWNKVQENGYKDSLYFHSANHLPTDEFDENIIKPERAVQLLKKEGLIVTIEQARLILEFLYKLADIALSQNLPK